MKQLHYVIEQGLHNELNVISEQESCKIILKMSGQNTISSKCMTIVHITTLFNENSSVNFVLYNIN